MFEESLLESTGAIRAHSRWPAAISVSVQLLLVSLLLLVPLLHPERLLAPAISTSLAAPIPAPPKIQPTPMRVHASAADATATPITAPTHTPALTSNYDRSYVPGPPSITSINLSGGAGAQTSLPIGLDSSTHANIRVAAPKHHPAQTER